jgi:hypothetical protein
MQQFSIETLFILYSAISFSAGVLKFLYRKIVWGTPSLVQNGLACPARFERATYALEALKMRLNNSRNNAFKVLAFGVA